ncbi:kinase-like protein [Neolentinus lepideus HHB14362 ss-1]|uniref:Kinase-like protein n=1 Tax=Neolentinus lepideus HHB14362 ss-1 TaxID=1314782 RepID=A0A165QUU3_9AGAM|nr:kinase-like protein [Neolentinus lepideus HHB14362 ss-1]
MRFMDIFKKLLPASREVKQIAPAVSDEKVVAIVKSSTPIPAPASIPIPHIEADMLEMLYHAYIKPEVLDVRVDLRLTVKGSVQQLSVQMKKESAKQMSAVVTPKCASVALGSKKSFVRSFIVRPAACSPLRLVNGSVVSSTQDNCSKTYSICSFSSTTKAANQSDTTLVTQRADLRKDYQWLKKLGSGAFGVVFCVKNKASGRLSAVKVVVKTHTMENHQLFVHEQRAMRVSGVHPFVISLEASGHDDFGYQLMTTYCPGGDLARELERVGSLSETRVRFYLSQLILAVEHLHTHKIIHRDIKPNNILLDARGNAVLADLGLCHIFDSQKPMTDDTWNPTIYHSSTMAEIDKNFDDPDRYTIHQTCGTEGYMAPEMISAAGYSFGVDVWALGITAYELRCGRLPWSGRKKGKKDRMLLLNQSLRDPLVFHARDDVSRKLQSVLQSMLHKDPYDRASIRELRRKPFFRSINWKKLAGGKCNAPFVPPQCLVTPQNHHPSFLPLGEPYSLDEDPYPELAYRSPLLDQDPSNNTFNAPGVFAKLFNKLTRPRSTHVQWEMVMPKSPSKYLREDGQKLAFQSKCSTESLW